MANNLMPVLCITLGLLTISAYGRVLESTNDGPVKVNVVSHATAYTGKTNYSDVLGLREITDAFPGLAEDNPDPCLSPQWSWIECNTDPQPRIIALDLYNKGLIDYDVPDFSSMDALLRVDLHRNTFYGEIPDFLGTLPVLQELNLAYNLFSGYIPDSIACNKKLKLRVDGNPLQDSVKCPILKSSSPDVPSTSPGTDTPSTSGVASSGDDGTTPTYYYTTTKKSKTPVILGSSISVFLLISIAGGIFAIFRHKSKAAQAIAAAASSAQNNNLSTDEVSTQATPINLSPQPQQY